MPEAGKLPAEASQVPLSTTASVRPPSDELIVLMSPCNSSNAACALADTRFPVGATVTVVAACVPVWVARSRSVASLLLAVAPSAMPESFVACAVVKLAVVLVKTVARG